MSKIAHLQRALGVGAPHRLQRVTGREREPELHVLVRGRDVLVGVGLDSHAYPDQHRLHASVLPREVGQHLDLVEGVDDDQPDACRDGEIQLRAGLVVAVQGDAARGKAGIERHAKLSARAHVDAQPLLGHPAGDRPAHEGLGRVVDVVPRERVAERPRTLAKVGLVQQEQRRAVLGDQVGHRTSVHAQGTGGRIAVDPGRPHVLW